MARIRHGAIALLAAGWLAATAAVAQPRFDFDTAPGRLSKQVVPQRYALELDVDPAKADFGGRVAITVNVRQPVKEIVLHADHLRAGRATLDGGRRLHVRPDAKASLWRLVPADGALVAPGEHRIEIAYRGRVNTAGEGLYLARHGEGGRERMLATQLESIHARNLFPAFDEPAFRAVFELSVRAPRGLGVHANMPAVETRDDKGMATTVHRFAPTPSMPTYLVALTVGRHDVLAGEVDGIPLRILTAPGKAQHGALAMRATKEVLPFFRGYFGVPYALPKLDQLAVPSTRNGAMEDWGLISYKEPMLLFDPAKSSPETERDVYHTVAHEIAHQWFGNLVTASSWDEIWLNEAFATWMQVKATDRFNPSWHVTLHSRTYVDRAMVRDAGPSTRPIRGQPVDETRVFDVFDEITYSKGGAVLSMLEQWIGPETFQRGLASYMQERRFSNATAGDLWHHLGAAAGQDVAAMARSWTDQPGFPVVGVSAACRNGRTEVSLTQERFSLGAPLPAQTWRIPVRLARGAQQATVLLEGASGSAVLEGCDGSAPLVANAGGRGFFRVAYEPALREQLRERFEALAPADRVALLSDSFALVQAGRLRAAEHFALLHALPRAQGPGRAALYAGAGKQLQALDETFAGLPAQEALRAAARRLLAPELARLGWQPRPGDDAETLDLRANLVELLARFDDAAVVERARTLYDDDAAGRAALPASLRAAVSVAVGMHADAARFERLRDQLRRAGSEEDRELYVLALAAGRDPARARTLLDWALGGELPPHTAFSVSAEMGRHSPHAALAFEHTRAHWPALAKKAGTSAFNQSAWLLPRAAESAVDPALADALVFEQQRRMGARGARAAHSVAARIQARAALRAREAEGFASALAGWQPAM